MKTTPSFLRRSALGNISLLLASIFFCIALLEVAVRALHLDYSLNHNLMYAPRFGWTQRPGASYQFKLGNEKIGVAFNSLGFRDVERHFEKPAGAQRVVVIGDSFCEGIQVRPEETFSSRLEQRLNNQAAGPWEVINLCVGDFGSAQEWLVFEAIGIRYSPDIVIHQIFPLNDICNNNILFFDVCKSSNDRIRPYIKSAAGGSWKWTTAQPVRNWLRQHWAVYRTIEFAWLKAGGNLGSRSEKAHRMILKKRGWSSFEPLLQVYNPNPLPVVENGWLATEHVFEKTARFLESKKIIYVPVVVPFEGALRSKWSRYSKVYPNLTLDRLYPEKRIQQFFRKLGVESILIQDVFDGHLDSLGSYRDGHFNPLMHQLTAEAIAVELSKRLNLKAIN